MAVYRWQVANAKVDAQNLAIVDAPNDGDDDDVMNDIIMLNDVRL